MRTIRQVAAEEWAIACDYAKDQGLGISTKLKHRNKVPGCRLTYANQVIPILKEHLPWDTRSFGKTRYSYPNKHIVIVFELATIKCIFAFLNVKQDYIKELK